MAKKLYWNLRKTGFKIYQGTGLDMVEVPNMMKVQIDEEVAKKYPSWFSEVEEVEVIEEVEDNEQTDTEEVVVDATETEEIDGPVIEETDEETTPNETEPEEVEDFGKEIEECAAKVEDIIAEAEKIRVKGALNEFAEKLGINLDTTKTLKEMKDDFKEAIKK